MGGEIRKIIPAIVLVLTMFFASNLSTKAQSWELDCPTDECLDNENVPWTYHWTAQLPMLYDPYKSPDCWVTIIYRKREPHENCPRQECEIEVQNVIVSGSCFYPYTDNSANPPITYDPILDFTDNLDIWIFAIGIWAQMGIEPCLIPGPNPDDCIYIPHFKSATCKRLIQNQDGSYSLTYCEDFNSCCKEILQVCRTSDGSLEHVWNSVPHKAINNCELNNDPDCKFTCNEQGTHWIPPKINFENIELNKDVFFHYENGKLNYNLIQKEYLCQITDIMGNVLFEDVLSSSDSIDLQSQNTKMLILKLTNETEQKTFKIMELK